MTWNVAITPDNLIAHADGHFLFQGGDAYNLWDKSQNNGLYSIDEATLIQRLDELHCNDARWVEIDEKDMWKQGGVNA